MKAVIHGFTSYVWESMTKTYQIISFVKNAYSNLIVHFYCLCHYNTKTFTSFKEWGLHGKGFQIAIDQYKICQNIAIFRCELMGPGGQ